MKPGQRLIACLATIAIACASVAPSTADAKPFKKTKVMELRYGWGTCDLAEFDMYEAMYPGIMPTAIVTFFNNGTFDAIDTQSGATGGGVYDKQGGQIEITIVPAGPLGVVQYVGSRVGPGEWAGEILANGVPMGNWRGEF